MLLCQGYKGPRVLGRQVGDFGSARSAIDEGYHWAEQDPPERARATHFSDAGRARHQALRKRVCSAPGLPVSWDLQSMTASFWSGRP